MLPPKLVARLEALRTKEAAYWDDEMYSDDALQDSEYREAIDAARAEAKPVYGQSTQDAANHLAAIKKRNR